MLAYLQNTNDNAVLDFKSQTFQVVCLLQECYD